MLAENPIISPGYRPDMDVAAEFIDAIFGRERTSQAIEFRSCPNDRDASGARAVFGRDRKIMELHIGRTDRPGMGVFVGVATRLAGFAKGNRANLAELPAWWLDIDCGKLGITKAAARAALASCLMPPSIVVDSGTGLHAYWLAREPIIVALDPEEIGPTEATPGEMEDRIVAVLKQLAGVFAGDLVVCELARIMRLPGTRNSKVATLAANGGKPALVTLLKCEPTLTYELDDLEQWLEIQRPLIERPAGATGGDGLNDQNPFTAYAAAVGYHLPIDVESMLSAMRYEGDGDTSIHQTQLRVSASLITRGEDDETVLAVLMTATATVAGPQGKFWNWRREERIIRGMIKGAHDKFADSKPQARQQHKAGNGSTRPSSPPDQEGAAPQMDQPPESTDDALALRFTAAHPELRFVAAWARWLRWDGMVWRPDDTRTAFDLARQTCRQAAAGTNKLSAAKIIASAKTAGAVELFAKADRRHAATVEQWDVDPWALNTPAGIVDLRTGLTRPHDPAAYMTRMTAVAPGGDCARWLAFLDRVTNGDHELQAFLQRVAGYALTGVTTEHALFFAYGVGGNGKGVFLNTLAAIMGNYAVVAPIETFTATGGSRHPTELAMLRGARLVTAQETEEGRAWAETRIKALTGGDPISARFMKQDFFTYTPQFKLILAGNHRPGLRNVDEAIRRRFHMLPFVVIIPQAERDPDLAEKLRAEWAGILAWMVQGCLEWQRVGLKPPPIVRAATEDYFASEDGIALWLAERCELGRFLTASSTVLFESWKEWAENAGERPVSQKVFSEALAKRGFAKQMVGPKGNLAGFIGLQLDPGDLSERFYNK